MIPEWSSLPIKPQWLGPEYRRNPSIPWPKVMQSNSNWKKYAHKTCRLLPECNDVEAVMAWHRNQIDCLTLELDKTLKQHWPADAPEWANYKATDANGAEFYYEEMPTMHEDCQCGYWSAHRYAPRGDARPDWRDSLIERPKPVKQKIDWSKLPQSIKQMWNSDHWAECASFPSPWIAWNCDEHTRGNPLPEGLIVEWYEFGRRGNPLLGKVPDWAAVVNFRIVGVYEEWAA